MAVIEVLKNN